MYASTLKILGVKTINVYDFRIWPRKFNERDPSYHGNLYYFKESFRSRNE